MKIDLKEFLALTSLMSAPLVTAACFEAVPNGASGDTDTADSTTGPATVDDGHGDGHGDGDDDDDDDANGDGDGDGDGSTDDGGTGHATTDDTGGTTYDDGTGASTYEGSESGTTYEGSESGSTGGEPIDVMDCCEAKVPPSCMNEEIAICVCAIDSFCCSIEGTWNQNCVQIAENDCNVPCP
jgi:hypothetical protein